MAAAAVIAVVGIVAYFALRPSSAESPAEPPFTLAGTLHLSSDVMKTAGLPGGYKCAGAREYGDVGPGAPVTVADESGKLLAKGAIKGSRDGSDGCSLTFQVDDVPTGAHFYRVQVAQHPEASYTEAEAKAGVDFLMGNTDPAPTTATAAPPSAAETVEHTDAHGDGGPRRRERQSQPASGDGPAPIVPTSRPTSGYRRSVPSASVWWRRARSGTTRRSSTSTCVCAGSIRTYDCSGPATGRRSTGATSG